MVQHSAVFRQFLLTWVRDVDCVSTSGLAGNAAPHIVSMQGDVHPSRGLGSTNEDLQTFTVVPVHLQTPALAIAIAMSLQSLAEEREMEEMQAFYMQQEEMQASSNSRAVSDGQSIEVACLRDHLAVCSHVLCF